MGPNKLITAWRIALFNQRIKKNIDEQRMFLEDVEDFKIIKLEREKLVVYVLKIFPDTDVDYIVSTHKNPVKISISEVQTCLLP